MPAFQDADIIIEAEGDAGLPQLQPDGSVHIPTPDGGLLIDLNPQTEEEEEASFSENLAEKLDDMELGRIASDLMEGIAADKQSRLGWIQQFTSGMDWLGLKIETPRADVGGSTAPLEGMSTVRHPMLQQAVLMFQANFRGEMLPADGPIKIETFGSETQETDEEAEALAEDMNYWITQVAREYYPDTMRMAYQYGFGGHGVKKVYYCPLRRRPASESVPMEDFIVSNTATDLQNAERVTQVIRMSKNTLKRMQLVGAYRQIELPSPMGESPGQIRQKTATIEGIAARPEREQDVPYELFECYCYLDIPGYEHKDKGEPTGLALPYRVVIESGSSKILAIHRDWEEDDEDCLRNDTFVDYIFVYAFGYYGMGLLHLLGNTEIAATGAWRLFIDALMFGNFPGFLYLKNGARQANNTFRVAPGSGAPVDAGGARDIRQAIMPLPYKSPDPSAIQFIQNVIATGERLGGVAQTAVGEGKQDAPVGTTLALLEQQTKVISAVHKNGHTSQAKEFALLREQFRKHPETLISAGKRNRRRKSKIQWTIDRLVAALDNYDIVPVADPNTPSHMHRMAKAQLLKQLQAANPQLYDAKKIDMRIGNMAQINDIEAMMVDPSQQVQQPDPKLISANASVMSAQASQASAQAANLAAQAKLIEAQAKPALAQMDIESKERLEAMRIAQTVGVHPQSAQLVHQELGALE